MEKQLHYQWGILHVHIVMSWSKFVFVIIVITVFLILCHCLSHLSSSSNSSPQPCLVLLQPPERSLSGCHASPMKMDSIRKCETHTKALSHHPQQENVLSWTPQAPNEQTTYLQLTCTHQNSFCVVVVCFFPALGLGKK